MKKIFLLSACTLLIFTSCTQQKHDEMADKTIHPCDQYESIIASLVLPGTLWEKLGPADTCNVIKVNIEEGNALVWKSVFEENLGTNAIIEKQLPPLTWTNQEQIWAKKISADTIVALYSLEFDGGLNLMMHFIQYHENSFEIVSYSLSASQYVSQAEKNLGFTYNEVMSLDGATFGKKADELKKETIRLFLQDFNK